MMTTELYPDFFNDVFGPVMQPGSSSHMAAPCRLGLMARSLLGEPSTQIRVLLDSAGSFAGTFGMMSEDSAMVAGALGIPPHDVRLFHAQSLAREAGIAVSFEFTDLSESQHPNAMKFVLTGSSGRTVSLVGDSTGGGMIETRYVNGYPLRVKGDAFVLLISGVRAPQQVARARQSLSSVVGAGHVEKADGSQLLFIKCADPPDLHRLKRVAPDAEFALLEPVLPVLTRPERKPQLFDTMTRWREIAAERGTPLWEVAVQYEIDASCWTPEQVIDHMRAIERAMYRQTHAAYDDATVVPVSPFRPNMAADWAKRMESRQRLTDDLVADTLRWAYGAGAGIPGVPVVAGPMGSGGGYIHAALWAVKQAQGYSDDDLLRGLFVAAGVGAIAFSRTEPTGEVIGCTGECGICGAMAAAGIAEMAGGTPQQVENASSLHLQAFIGMPCDPIAGGKGQPCRSRIIAAICMASVFADLALAGRDGVLPLHEVIDVADAVGRQLPPSLLCTARGGAAAAPAAQRQSIAFHKWFQRVKDEGAPLPPGNLI
jgi:L-serine dehydratase